jgi:pimeloyl-ACP methyl ester carboxylesterase
MSEQWQLVERYYRSLATAEKEGKELVLEGGASDSLSALLESPGLDDGKRKAAQEALTALRERRSLSRAQAEAWEAIVLPYERPVLDIIGATFDESMAGEWAAPLKSSKDRLKACLRSIGRVKPAVPHLPYAGTAFIVAAGPDGERLMMTNRHVAKIFVDGVGRLAFVPHSSTIVDLKREVGRDDEWLMRVVDVPLVHPYWDMALLRVRPLDAEAPPPLVLSSEELARNDGRNVAVIGYPNFDGNNDVGLQTQIFRGVFGCKRLQPGKLTERLSIESFGRPVDAQGHDASTLCGNSGSAVICLDTGRVVGLHFAGFYLKSNYSVPTQELFRDPRVRDLGLNFQTRTDLPGPDLEVEAAWAKVDRAAVVVVPAQPNAENIAAVPTPLSSTAIDWYERTSDEVIAEALRRDRPGTVALLRECVGEHDALEIAEDLVPDAGQESLFRRETNPDYPEIIFLHGIMGGHLTDVGASTSRVWLNPLSLRSKQVADRLSLAPDGLTDAHPGTRVQPDANLRVIYAKATRRWKKAGFAVHEFAYDWRKSLTHCADRLHFFLEMLRLDRPRRTFALVAHSMGGLVAAMYAVRHSEWRDIVDRAVFMGSPLRGSFAPIEALLGSHGMLKKLAWIHGEDPDEMQQMVKTLPGLLDMLPCPQTFPKVARLYRRSGWGSDFSLAQHWLDQSKRVKSILTDSPILARTTLLVGLDRETIVDLADANPSQPGLPRLGPRNGVGDGTVPARAALIENVPAYEVHAQHMLLPRDNTVIRTVASLLADGGVPDDVSEVDRTRLDRTFPSQESATLELSEEALEAMQTRMHNSLRADDVAWLLDPSMQPPPR